MGLTDEQITKLAGEVGYARFLLFARAVIAAHEASKPTDAEVQEALKYIEHFIDTLANRSAISIPEREIQTMHIETIRRALTASKPAVDLGMVLEALKDAKSLMFDVIESEHLDDAGGPDQTEAYWGAIAESDNINKAIAYLEAAGVK
jgi:hypothetical protein